MLPQYQKEKIIFQWSHFVLIKSLLIMISLVPRALGIYASKWSFWQKINIIVNSVIVKLCYQGRVTMLTTQ